MRGSEAKFLRQLLLWQPLKAFAPLLLGMLFSLLLLGLSQAAFLGLMAPFMEAFFKPEHSKSTTALLGNLNGILAELKHLKEYVETYLRREAWMLPVAIIVVGLVKAAASFSFSLSQTVLSLRWGDYMRRQLFRSIMRQTWQQSASRSPAHWMSVLMNDVAFLQNRLSDGVTAFAKDGVTCLASFITVFFLHWPSGLVLLALAPFMAFGFGRAAQRIAWFAKFWQMELAKLSSAVLDIRERFPMIFSQDGQNLEMKRFQRHVERYYQTMRRSIMIRSLLAPGMEWLGFLLLCVLYYLTGRQLWGSDFDAIHMFQVFGATASMFKPLRNLGEQLTTFAELRGAMRPSMDLLAKLIPSGETDTVCKASERLSELDVKLLSAGYRDDKPEIIARDMHLKAGQCVAIVGPSGAGKSTLIRAFSGLLQPFSWQATRDGTVALSWERLGAMATLVSQSPFVFAGSIRDNLLYAWPFETTPNDAVVWQSLEKVHLAALVRQLPGQLNATLSALQKNLSGGQIQRLLIARALLRPEQIIVCDEVTASLDSALEFEMTEVLCAHARATGAILLFITHRLGQLQLFDLQWQVSGGELCQILGTVTN